MQGRVGDAGFAGELLESQISPAFAKELSQLLCQSICHDWDFAAERVPQVGYLALRSVFDSLKSYHRIHQNELMENERENFVMQIMLKKDGVETGPFTREDAVAMLADGRINRTDLAFHDGLSNWLPVQAVIAPRATPPPFKEKSEGFEASRVKPNETIAQIVNQTKSLDWAEVIPYKLVLQDKPWNLRWVRWMIWFAGTFWLVNYLSSRNSLSGDQATLILAANWALMLAFGVSFIIKPDHTQVKKALSLIFPSLLITVVLLVIARKVSVITTFYQATVSENVVKQTFAILGTVLVNQLILVSPFAFIYLKQKQNDSVRTIMYYGFLGGLAISLAPALASLFGHNQNRMDEASLGIFETPPAYFWLTTVAMSGIGGSIMGFLVASGSRHQKNVLGWLAASVVIPTLLATCYWALRSSLMGVVVIVVSIFLMAAYVKKTSEQNL